MFYYIIKLSPISSILLIKTYLLVFSAGLSANGNIHGRKRKRHPRNNRIKVRIKSNSHLRVRVLASTVIGGKPPRRFALGPARLFALDEEAVELVDVEEEAEFTRESLN